MKFSMKILITLSFYIIFCIKILGLMTEQMPYPSKTIFFKWDHQYYIQMAKDKMNLKKTNCQTPYCYRIILPAIVAVFPQNMHLFIFKVVSYAGIYLTSLAFFYFLRVLKFNQALSFIGLNFYLFSRFGPKFIIFDNFRPEALSIFFVLCCFIFLLKQKQILFSVFLALAILTKEQPVAMIFVYYIYHCKKIIDLQALKKTLIVGAVPFLIFFLLRSYYPSTHADYPFYYYFYRRIVQERGLTILFALMSTLGIVFYIVLLHPRNSLKHLFAKKYLLVYLIFQIMILFSAGDDLERFVMYFWPVAIPLALWNIAANKKLYVRLALLLIPIQIYISKIYKFYTFDGKPTFINEQHYVNNLAVMMNRDIFVQDLWKMIICGVVVFCAAKLIARRIS